MQNFSERLAHAIKIAGKPKGELANHCGVALSSVSRWLAGTVPRSDVARKIALFLGVDVNWLVYGNSNLAQEPNETPVLREDPAEYGAVKPIIQPFEEALKNTVGNDALDFIEQTARFMRGQDRLVRRNFYNQLRLLVDQAEKMDNEPLEIKEP